MTIRQISDQRLNCAKPERVLHTGLQSGPGATTAGEAPGPRGRTPPHAARGPGRCPPPAARRREAGRCLSAPALQRPRGAAAPRSPPHPPTHPPPALSPAPAGAPRRPRAGRLSASPLGLPAKAGPQAEAGAPSRTSRGHPGAGGLPVPRGGTAPPSRQPRPGRCRHPEATGGQPPAVPVPRVRWPRRLERGDGPRAALRRSPSRRSFGPPPCGLVPAGRLARLASKG